MIAVVLLVWVSGNISFKRIIYVISYFVRNKLILILIRRPNTIIDTLRSLLECLSRWVKATLVSLFYCSIYMLVWKLYARLCDQLSIRTTTSASQAPIHTFMFLTLILYLHVSNFVYQKIFHQINR